MFATTILEGSEIARARQAELSADSDRIAKESDATEEGTPVKRKMRERKIKRDTSKGRGGDGTRIEKADDEPAAEA